MWQLILPLFSFLTLLIAHKEYRPTWDFTFTIKLHDSGLVSHAHCTHSQHLVYLLIVSLNKITHVYQPGGWLGDLTLRGQCNEKAGTHVTTLIICANFAQWNSTNYSIKICSKRGSGSQHMCIWKGGTPFLSVSTTRFGNVLRAHENYK